MTTVTPWDTQDGQKWLAKALDPAGFQQVDLKGLPDQEAHNVVLLNYQSQFAVEPPLMYGVSGTDASTYECELYAFQDPIVFGVAASYPTGTEDPLHDNLNVNVCFGASTDDASEAHAWVATPPSIKFNSSGTLFPRTCKRFVNSQVNGYGDISSVYESFKGFAQRHRVIYGALQAVPTCSSQDNSGTISVSQQAFIGDSYNNQTTDGYGATLMDNATELTLDNASTRFGRNRTGVRIYQTNDFPDAEDNIRNPASLLTRFYEGAYVPYKLKNPFSEDFITTGDAIAQYAPFWVVGAAYCLNNDRPSVYIPMDWDMASGSFVSKIDPTTNQRIKVQVRYLKLTLMSQTGAIKDIIFCNNHDATYLTNHPGVFTAQVDLDAQQILNNDSANHVSGLLSDNNSDGYYNNFLSYNGVPESGAANKVFDVYRCGEASMPRCRMPDSNVAAVLCKALNMKGNVTLLFRMGVEIIVNAASVYSPFNHKSPAYDEAALKSYLRVIHHMSDGFYGNAATDAFHVGFYNYLISQIYNQDETVDFANRGSYWRGVVRSG